MRSGMVGPFSALPSSDLPKLQGRRPASQSAPRNCKPRPSPLPRASGNTVEKSSGTDPKNFGPRVAAFLRRQHREKVAEHVAAEIDVPIARVEKWIEGASAPRGFDAVRLFCAYGPEFITAVWPEGAPAWLRAIHTDRRQVALEAEIEARRKELNLLLSAR